MEYHFTTDRLVALSDNTYVGEVSFPFVSEEEKRVVVERVFVAPEYRNHGVAADLMSHFVQYADDHQLTVRLMCPYAKAYFKAHAAELNHLLLPEDRF